MTDSHESRPPQKTPWWRGGTIYQIYPRSFCDLNGDGIGDLPGILQKLDYIADLGVDAIWISPFFLSPMKDFGYDVADYRAVDPIFGTLEDFDRIVERTHQLGMKLMIDQVISHTSDQHQWFVDSRQSRTGDKADWYVWADPKPDGGPPNNWHALFGGPAWEWDIQRQQYYLHNFLVSQPDLNFHHPEVRRQILDEMRFWLQRGVDGFRLDVVNFYYHDAELRDNPARELGDMSGDVMPKIYPYAYQQHLYDRNRPDNLEFLRELRALTDEYPDAALLGEIGGDQPLPVMADYTAGGDKLHMAYAFSLLTERFGAGYIRDVIGELEQQLGDGWPCWSLGNHDVTRVMSRWGRQIGAEDSDAFAKVLMAMLLSLRGSVCIYQGEELGLAEAEVPREHMRDPWSITLWPKFPGRDGCRTAMPWTRAGDHAGFSPKTPEAVPWLAVPTPDNHRRRAAETQVGRDDSVYAAYRTFLRWRKQQPPLCLGELEFTEVQKDHEADNVLAFVRSHRGRRVLAAFNLSPQTVTCTIPGGAEPLKGHGFAEVQPADATVELAPFAAFFAALP